MAPSFAFLVHGLEPGIGIGSRIDRLFQRVGEGGVFHQEIRSRVLRYDENDLGGRSRLALCLSAARRDGPELAGRPSGKSCPTSASASTVRPARAPAPPIESPSTKAEGEEEYGRAVFEGREHAEPIGEFEGRISVWDFGRLSEILDALEFQEMPPSFVASWPNDATITIETDHVDGSYTVNDYGRQGTAQFTAIQLAIDAIGAKIEWRPLEAP